MVRLKAIEPLSLVFNFSFQFQNGAIKSKSPQAQRLAAAPFQFQNGAIKSGHGGGLFYHFFAFQFQNGAIKRLRGRFEANMFFVFQFQNGAIKRSYHQAYQALSTDFNSKMVRLKVTFQQT